MAIVKIDPEKWQEVNAVQVDSDAVDNAKAVREIEDWAAQHGFARTTEYWLRRIHRQGGAPVFRGMCYRLTQEEHSSANVEIHAIDRMVSELPVTPHEPSEGS